MVSLDERVAAFVGLSEFLRSPENRPVLDDWAERAHLSNNWFVPENVAIALQAIAEMLADPIALRDWCERYGTVKQGVKVGVVMAGNIPAVGFHDLLCVLISGHQLLLKPSKDDHVLIRLIVDKLCEIQPAFRDYIRYVERINEAEAYIATGSDNTARYFEYYFSSKPNIIRKNRVSVGVLSGEETDEQLYGLCEDVFRYYGLGCRNVSKILVPEGYGFSRLYEIAESFRDYATHHHKYFNNYEYNKSVLLVNGEEHLDNGYLLLRKSSKLASPLSVLFFDTFSQFEEVYLMLEADSDKIQCVVSGSPLKIPTVRFGESQRPGLSDYPDGIDTMDFLSRLSR